MKKLIGILILFVILFVPSISALAKEVPIYLFYGDTCPICEMEREYLSDLKNEYDNIVLYEFETYRDRINYQNMLAVKDMFSISSSGVPFTVVADVGILGFSDPTKERIESLVKKYTDEEFHDRTGIYLGYVDEEVHTTDDIEITSVENTKNSDNDEGKQEIKRITIIKFSLIIIAFGLIIGVVLKKYTKK